MGNNVDYNMVPRDSREPSVGVCHRRGGNSSIPPVWMVGFVVADLESSLARVQAQGGEVIAAPRRAGNGRYAMVKDPAGGVLCDCSVRLTADQSGNANATYESPDFVPIFPPPAAITTYCLPPTA
jgi:predicted enzyme related to lactoylglutathione lyase